MLLNHGFKGPEYYKHKICGSFPVPAYSDRKKREIYVVGIINIIIQCIYFNTPFPGNIS